MASRLALPLAVLLTLPLLAAQQSQSPSTQQPPPRPPVFRGGAHYVRVDAYPTGKDGRIVEGLTRDDFEVYEDGKLQEVEQAEFVAFDTWTPEGERKDPRTQQDAYDLAADPTYRVFVIVLDPSAYNMQGRHYLRGPLHEFIERNLGPRDLFDLLSTENEWTDLVLRQTTTGIGKIIDSDRWLDPDRITERDWPYVECGMESLLPRKKLDDTFTLLEGLVRLLGQVREQRTGIVFVSNGLQTPGVSSGSGRPGGIPQMPRIGGQNGRIGELTRGDAIGGGQVPSFCATERTRLQNLDFGERYRDLLRSARQGNVSFYPVSPLGLQGLPFSERGGVDMGEYHRQNARRNSLLTLASETGGIAVVNTNDLSGGLHRVAADLQAYYVLGYYTSNTTWNGKVRQITVRLKPKRNTIRARRQYVAPTEAEIAALTTPAKPHVATEEETALATLARARPDVPFAAYGARSGSDISIVLEMPETASAWPAGTEITIMAETADGDSVGATRTRLAAAGRIAVVTLPIPPGPPPTAAAVRVRGDGMIVTDRIPLGVRSSLVGDPVFFRNGTRAANLSCVRTDGIHVEWEVLSPLQARAARLLDRTGVPLPVPVELRQNDAAVPGRLVIDLSLAPLSRGEYLVELTATDGKVSERKLLPLRIR